MKRGAEWLSRSVETLARKQEESGRPPCFDVVVIGSGYGGAVAAARLSALAGANGDRLTVCVLERGQEYPPGSFPAGMSELVGHQRVSGAAPIGGQTLPEGLMDWHVGGDVWGLVANGLGGGSLINAGVCAPAQDVVLDRDGWPEPWRGNRTRWDGLYRRAGAALGAQPWPRRRVPKQAAMERVARDSGGICTPVSVTIALPGSAPVPGTADTAPEQPCIECGDCFTGCNVGAKRTLSHTYLGRAYRHGAELYCGATVRSVAPLPASVPAPAPGPGPVPAPEGPRWAVHYLFTDPLLLPGRSETFVVHAHHVVLAAGTFGSTEILMRSRSPQFEVSGRLGEGFSANGDILAAFYDTGAEVRSSADETEPLAERRVGPTITSQIEWPSRSKSKPRSESESGSDTRDTARDVMQDLSVPGALGWLFREALTTMMVPQRWTRFSLRTNRPGDRDIYAVDEKAIRNTLLTVSYADDGALGRLEPGPGWGGALRDGSVVVRWKKPATNDWFTQADARLAGRVPKGSFLLRNPLTQFMPQPAYLGIGQSSSRLLTVHPLGGCRMGESADKGVVDPYGRVYDAGIDLADRGTPATEQLRSRHEHRVAYALHEGLHVLDGSIVPTALGINPLLTITALAEGAIDQWELAYGWTPVAAGARAARALSAMPVRPAHVAPPSATAVRFGEGMNGKLAPCPPPPDPETEVRVAMHVRFDRVGDLREFLQRPDKSVNLEADFAVFLQDVKGSMAPARRDIPLSLVLQSLKGKVQWLGVERNAVFQRFWRSFITYMGHRRAADSAAKRAAKQAGRLSAGVPLWELVRAGTHFGAVRQLAYEFEKLAAPWDLVRHAGFETLTLPAGTVLFGTKRLGYLQSDRSNKESANPWHQIGNLDLKARLPDGRTIELGRLEFDEMAMLDRYDMPLAIVDQSDMPSGMRDLASLALYFGRMMFGLHMLSFRRPDYPVEERGRRELMRLPPLRYDPGRGYDALSVTAIDVPHPLPGGEVIHLRLTRLHRHGGARPGLPVLLLHGFGSGGIQFTHPVIETPLGPWLAGGDRAFDVWVGELRTSIGLPTSERQWVMDDVATEDIPRLVQTVCERTQSEQVQVVAHCIGSAMFGMAALAGRLQHGHGSRIASAVLMQVGPCAVLPRTSRARSHVALRLQQLFGAPKVGSVASQDPSDLESMLDRVLGTFLYPEDQRAHYRLTGDHDRNVRRTNANRSAGTFGQLFQYENMPAEVLDVIEDLLGDCNLTTYAQTAEYAFGGRLVDQRGDDAYVTDARLERFFDFPVLFVHGRKNETFAPRTNGRNVEMVERLNLKFDGHQVRKHMVEGYGHLDCVVGRGIEQKVFAAIFDHLAVTRTRPPKRTPPVAPEVPMAAVPCRPRLPSIGPWIGAVSTGPGGALQLRVGLRIDDLGKSLQGVFAVAGPSGDPQRLSPPGWMPLRQECIVDVTIDAAALAPCLAAGDAAPLDVLISPVHDAPPANGADFRARVNGKFDRLMKEAARRGVPIAAIPGLVLDARWLRRQFDPAPRDLGLVLGACRQRPMLVDRELADRSMKHIRARLDDRTDAPGGHAPIDALVLSGDQIYGDSRVDATHPGSSGGRYFDAYREAWTAPWQREVMRRRPTYMVTDDHEFRNDYNNRIARGRPREFGAAREAWNTYQLAAGPGRALPNDPTADWRHFRLRGFGVFLTDTRSERKDVDSVARGEAAIMGPVQMRALKDWLLDLQNDPGYGHRAKIVVTASPVAPLFAEAGGGWSSLRGDGWQRFPGSLAELLGWIARHEIGNVLFLSGDYHRHARCTLHIEAHGRKAVTATSIVTGGLYAPYPFANATRDEWLEPDHLALTLPKCPGVRWSYTVDADAPGDGYTRLTLEDTGALVCDWVAMP